MGKIKIHYVLARDVRNVEEYINNDIDNIPFTDSTIKNVICHTLINKGMNGKTWKPEDLFIEKKPFVNITLVNEGVREVSQATCTGPFEMELAEGKRFAFGEKVDNKYLNDLLNDVWTKRAGKNYAEWSLLLNPRLMVENEKAVDTLFELMQEEEGYEILGVINTKSPPRADIVSAINKRNKKIEINSLKIELLEEIMGSFKDEEVLATLTQKFYNPEMDARIEHKKATVQSNEEKIATADWNENKAEIVVKWIDNKLKKWDIKGIRFTLFDDRMTRKNTLIPHIEITKGDKTVEINHSRFGKREWAIYDDVMKRLKEAGGVCINL